MGTWQPAMLDEALSILEQAAEELYPAYRQYASPVGWAQSAHADIDAK